LAFFFAKVVVAMALLEDGDSGEVAGYAGLPFGGAGVVDAYAA